MANAVRVKKSTLATFYVYVVFLVCSLLISCVVFAKTIGETTLLSHLWYFTLTLVFLNSSLNPLIYCWKMRHIRQLSNRKRIEGRSESRNAHLRPAAVSSMDTDGALASGLYRLHYFRFELFLCKHR